MEKQLTVCIVGASAAGLAMAACLKEHDTPYALLEKSDAVGDV